MAVATTPPPTAPRYFGRFELRRMLGRSTASAMWLAVDPRLKQEVALCVPRARPSDAREQELWLQDVQSGARLQHPRLAEVLEVAVHDGWPYLTAARGKTTTLAERVASGSPMAPLECVQVVVDLLEGLAYAHDAGVAHQDLGLHTVWLDGSGHGYVAGLGCGLARPEPGAARRASMGRQQFRQAAERDVLMVGLLLHRLLANHPALDDPDLGSAADRVGPEIVRLPWTTPHTVPETLRAIVNRATDRQQRQRYLNARTLLSALQGWVRTNAEDSGGPLALLLDRLNTVGALPSRAGTERALVGALSHEMLRVDDFVDVVVKNPAMVWEMLRSVNTASFQSSSAVEPVSTLSRAVVLLGQDGIRKVSAGLRQWPGALGAQVSLSGAGESSAVRALEQALRSTCLAGAIARLMAPFTIHDEEASVAAMAQRLGHLLILYHFPDEAAQIQRLMQAAPPAEEGGTPSPGMPLETAVSAVLGVNLDDLSVAVLQHWGLHERLIHAARPLPQGAPVRLPRSAQETLRAVASLGNELTAAMAVESAKQQTALHQVVVRYARALGVTAKECQEMIDRATRLVDGLRRPEPVNPA